MRVEGCYGLCMFKGTNTVFKCVKSFSRVAQKWVTDFWPLFNRHNSDREFAGKHIKHYQCMYMYMSITHVNTLSHANWKNIVITDLLSFSWFELAPNQERINHFLKLAFYLFPSFHSVSQLISKISAGIYTRTRWHGVACARRKC